MFIGRKKELKLLNLLINKKSASLVVLRGRRRIGKSKLAKYFGSKHRFLSFSGLAPSSRTTAQSQRDEFAKQLATNLHSPQVVANDWNDLFAFLLRETRIERVVILFDEISWMGDKDKLFLSKLKNAWEQLKDNPKLILILCGSVSTWIEKNILGSTGFMGRVSLDMVLDELPLNDCNTMLEKIGVKASSQEKFKLLSITGGVPRYLEEIQANLSADENIKHLAFDQSGILFREFEDIFHDLFISKSQYYRAIVELLVQGPLSFTEICQNLGVEKSGFWSEYLDELIKAGFLRREFTWSLKTGKTSKLSCYRLSDNYLRFYLKYISPNKQKISTGLFDNKTISALPGWESIMGLQFENLVLNNNKFIWKQLNLDPNDILSHGPYFQSKTTKQMGCQIDYLIQTRFNTLLACEIKFSKNKINTSVIASMQKKEIALNLPKGMAYWPVLIHVNGVSTAVIDEQYFSRAIDFSELLIESD